MAKTDTSTAQYQKTGKGVGSIPMSVDRSGQQKAKKESGYPGMQDSTPREEDKHQSAR